MNSLPFNVNAALQGAPVVQRNGVVLKAPKFEFDTRTGELLLHENGTIRTYTQQGRYLGWSVSDHDLFMVPNTTRLYCTVYQNQFEDMCCHVAKSPEAQAEFVRMYGQRVVSTFEREVVL